MATTSRNFIGCFSLSDIATDDPLRQLNDTLRTLSVGSVVVAPVAVGSSSLPGLQASFDAYKAVRAHVYVSEGGVMDLRDSGLVTDEDADDGRSIHVAAIERKPGGYAVVGCVRIILRGADSPIGDGTGFGRNGSSLPSQSLFEGTLEPADRDAELAAEVSRYVIQGASFVRRAAIAQALHAAVVEVVQRANVPRTFAVVEDWLAERLNALGVPTETLTPPRLIPQYGTENFVVRIGIDELAELLPSGGALISVLDGDVSRMTEGRFDRNFGFWSVNEQHALGESLVALAGVGGDGYQLGLSLLRMGVRRLRISDPETFEAENLNRVPGARVENLGRLKVDCFVEDALAIAPDAHVEVIDGGVTADNVDDLLDGAALVIDETELTRLALGAMISDAARRHRVPVLVVMNVGFAGQVTAYAPEGPGFREMMGIPAEASLEDIAKRELDLSRCVPYIAPYTDLGVLAAVQEGAPLPSIVQGVSQACALGASQAFLWLTRSVSSSRPSPVTLPVVRYVDALTGESCDVTDIGQAFAETLARMRASAANGHTTDCQYPVDFSPSASGDSSIDLREGAPNANVPDRTPTPPSA